VNRQIGVEESKYGVTGDALFTGREGSRDLLFEFSDPHYSHISQGTVGARNIKFGKLIDHQGTNERNVILGQRGWGRGHVICIGNFGTPSISRELLDLETLNLVRQCKMQYP